MLVIAAAVLFALAQVRTAQAAVERASAARRKAAAALEAKARADDAAEEARVELNRVRAQTAEQLAAYQTATGGAQSGARTELEEVRAAATKAVTDAREAAEVSIQKAIADRDRILAERAADMRQQIEQAKADAQAQVKAFQDQAPVAQQRVQHGLAEARARGPAGRRKPKMTPGLVDKAQRMYDSRRFSMAEIAQSCAVSPTTIYRHIRTDRTTKASYPRRPSTASATAARIERAAQIGQKR